MKILFRPIVIAVALAVTIVAGLLVRHTERGYVQYIEGNLTEAERLLIERGQQGDVVATYVAAGLVAQGVRHPEDICKSRQLYALASEQGVPAARTLYVASLLKITSTSASCNWMKKSLNKLIGSDNGVAAVMMSILIDQKTCGGPAPQQSLMYLLLSKRQGIKGMDDRIDFLAALPETSIELAEAEAQTLLEQSRPPVDWLMIYGSEPSGGCQGVTPD